MEAVIGEKPEDTVFIRKPVLTVEAIKLRLADFEHKLDRSVALLQTKGRSQTSEVKKLRLKCAMGKQALLATKPLGLEIRRYCSGQLCDCRTC